MDIVKTITTKIRRHNFTFREGRRIYYGLQMDTTRLVWSRNLCEGWQIDIDGRRITVDCVLREITIGNGEIINYWHLAAYRSAAIFYYANDCYNTRRILVYDRRLEFCPMEIV